MKYSVIMKNVISYQNILCMSMKCVKVQIEINFIKIQEVTSSSRRRRNSMSKKFDQEALNAANVNNLPVVKVNVIVYITVQNMLQVDEYAAGYCCYLVHS